MRADLLPLRCADNNSARFSQQYPFLIANVIQLLDEGEIKDRLKSIHSIMVQDVQQAQSFSEGARMKVCCPHAFNFHLRIDSCLLAPKVAEESFQSKLKVPKNKGFRGIVPTSVFANGPCVRSEVVFRFKGKHISKVGPQAPHLVVCMTCVV